MNDIEIDNSKLSAITVGELKKAIFSPGVVYWVRAGGKLTKIIESGDVIDQARLNKFEEGNTVLKIDLRVNIDVIARAKLFFGGLKHAVHEEQRLFQRDNILTWFHDIFWTGEEAGNLLDLIKIGENAFYRFDPEFTEVLKNAGVTLFQRSALVGSTSVFMALMMGYTDYKLLCDLYHISFLYDFALGQEGVSFNILQASEKERVQAGDGVSYLFMGENPGPELDVFMEHTKIGTQNALERCKDYFYDPAFIENISFHHEKVNGKGFPVSIHCGEVGEFESIIIFANHVVPYSDMEFDDTDGRGFLKRILDRYSREGINEAVSPRIRHFVESTMAQFEEAPEV